MTEKVDKKLERSKGNKKVRAKQEILFGSSVELSSPAKSLGRLQQKAERINRYILRKQENYRVMNSFSVASRLDFPFSGLMTASPI